MDSCEILTHIVVVQLNNFYFEAFMQFQPIIKISRHVGPNLSVHRSNDMPTEGK